MNGKVTVVDYGVGNLFSVRRALESCGATNIVLSSSAEDIGDAERLILPGVGAFEDGMQGLQGRGLVDPIRHYAISGKPLLGICLGMQVLATQSEEFGLHRGLNLIPGSVISIPRESSNGDRLKVPFIGWTALQGNDEALANSCLKDLGTSGAVYLVHSFHFEAGNTANVLATYQNGGHCITAAIRQGNITGLQFHPEKSGRVGLQIMANFVNGP